MTDRKSGKVDLSKLERRAGSRAPVKRNSHKLPPASVVVPIIFFVIIVTILVLTFSGEG